MGKVLVEAGRKREGSKELSWEARTCKKKQQCTSTESTQKCTLSAVVLTAKTTRTLRRQLTLTGCFLVEKGRKRESIVVEQGGWCEVEREVTVEEAKRGASKSSIVFAKFGREPSPSLSELSGHKHHQIAEAFLLHCSRFFSSPLRDVCVSPSGRQ